MNFCDIDIEDYTIKNCGIDYAGIIGLLIIHQSENPSLSDLSDPEYIATRLAEPDKKFFLIRNARGQYEDIEPIEEEDLEGLRVTGATHTATIEVPDLKPNRDFWDEIQRFNWKIGILTSGGLMYYVDKPVSFYPKINNQRGIKTAAFFEVVMKWYDLSNPYVLPEPFDGQEPLPDPDGGIFDYTFDFTFE